MFSYSVESSSNMVVLSITVGLMLITYYYLTYTYDKWRKLNIAHLRPIPLFGNTFKMALAMTSQSETYDRIYRQFPDNKFCGFYEMRTPILMIRDPELINAILIKDFSYFTDHGLDIDPATNLMARSMFFDNGQRWKTIRQKLSPGLTSSKIKGTFDQIKKCSEQIVSNINDKSGPINVNETIRYFAIDLMGLTTFSWNLDTSSSKASEFRKYVMALMGINDRLRVFKLILICLFPKIARFFGVQIFQNNVFNFFHSMINEAIEYRTNNNVVFKDMLQSIMKAREELVLNNETTVKEKFTELDIIANTISIFLVNAESVTVAISLCLYELALNEDIQDNLRKEINSAKIKYNGKFTSEFLAELTYLKSVVDEVLRKYSIISSVIRVATEDYDVPGETLIIKKGQKILIPMYSIHNDPKYYPNPNIFNPERFTGEDKSKRKHITFFPFGKGPRHCIAKRFAEVEIKLALSEIISNFKVQPCQKTEVPLQFIVSLLFKAPKNGIWLNFKSI